MYVLVSVFPSELLLELIVLNWKMCRLMSIAYSWIKPKWYCVTFCDIGKYHIAVQRISIISCWKRWFTSWVEMQTVFCVISSAKDSTGWRLFYSCMELLKSRMESRDLDKEVCDKVPHLHIWGTLCDVFRLLNLLNWSTEHFSLDQNECLVDLVQLASDIFNSST